MQNNQGGNNKKNLVGQHLIRLQEASREGRLYSASSPHVLVIESDRLHRVFSQYKDALADSRSWIQSVFGTASLIAGYLGIDTFKTDLLNGGEWRGLFIALIVIGVYFSGKDALRAFKAKTLDQIISDLIKDSDPVETNGSYAQNHPTTDNLTLTGLTSEQKDQLARQDHLRRVYTSGTLKDS